MYLKMDETSGTSIEDATLRGHTATAAGASVGNPGVFGNCRDLAGSGQISLPGDSSDFDSAAYSVALWLRKTAENSERGLMCHEGGFGGFGWRLATSISVPGILSIVHNGVAEHASPSPVDLSSSWHRVFVTFSGSTSKMYVDGALISSMNMAARITAVGTGELMRIGCLSPISFFQFGFLPGQVDEIGYWNVEVSASDVTADWNGGAGLLFENFGH